MSVDLSKFNAAMSEYLRHNKREIPAILKRVNADIQFRAAKALPAADKAEIRNLEEKPWWFRYIAKLVSGGVKVSKSRKNKTTGKREKIKVVESGKGRTQNGYINFLKKVSRQIIAARVRGTSLLSSAFYKAAAAIKGGVASKGSNLNRSKGTAQLKTGDVMKCECRAVVYSSDTDSSNSADVRMERAMQVALDDKAADLGVYIARKQKEKADKLSGKS